MCAKSRRRSQSNNRTVAPHVLEQAREVALKYQVILACEEGTWHGRGLELPLVFGEGKTPAKCIDDTREAFAGVVALMLDKGERPPTPAREGTRTEQVNVRLTAEEKAVLEATARRKGFKGLSDFIRAAALESSR